MVAPDLRGRGLGRWLLERIEEVAPDETSGFALITGAGSEANLRRYRRAGYRPDRPDRPADDPRAVRLAKRRRRAPDPLTADFLRPSPLWQNRPLVHSLDGDLRA